MGADEGGGCCWFVVLACMLGTMRGDVRVHGLDVYNDNDTFSL